MWIKVAEPDQVAGESLTRVDAAGKALALIEFLPGVSVSAPTPAQARAVGEALAGG